ncbi:MAG: hypothetical protein EU547_02260 [Promethearchaeota archaeon]|nr:MAG: hypothetical protein EU547_02260 [Candidatus Lokiarchaeota archaeon]
MYNLNPNESIESIFSEIYHLILSSKRKIYDPWIKITEVTSFQDIDDYEIDQFIDCFPFIKRERWNHISIDKIEFILNASQILSLDIKRLAEKLLNFQGFERLIKEIISKMGYLAITNFRFTDHSEYKNKTSQERYEVDIIGLDAPYLLIIDAKEWIRRSPFASLNNAANLQYQRGIALTKNPKILKNLLNKLIDSPERFKKLFEKSFPLKLIPIMVTLEDNYVRLNQKQIPFVSIHQLTSFLSELEIENKKSLYYKCITISKNIFQEKNLE